MYHVGYLQVGLMLTTIRPDGTATATAPATGWETSDLANYFRTTYSAYERSATRPIPTSASSSSPSSAPRQPSSKANTGAIAGGVVGGVVALIGIVALAWFCLRRQRRQKQAAPSATTDPQTRTSQQHGAAEKFVATPTTTSYPSTFPSPHPHTPGYSPQASPPPPSWSDSTYYQGSPPMPQHTWGSHDMPIQYASQQPYFPPPQEPSQSPTKHSHTASVELPPNEVLEMPEVRSPVPKRGI